MFKKTVPQMPQISADLIVVRNDSSLPGFGHSIQYTSAVICGICGSLFLKIRPSDLLNRRQERFFPLPFRQDNMKYASLPGFGHSIQMTVMIDHDAAA